MKIPSVATALLTLGINSCQGSGEENMVRGADSRRLEYEPIWKYEPKSKITDIAAIDQDLRAIIRELRKYDFERAERIYKEGGHSGSVAKLKILTEGGLREDVTAGVQVVGPSLQNGDDGARGFLYRDAKTGDDEIIVQYEVSPVQENYSFCQVGALTDTFTNGCFESFGNVAFTDLQSIYSYEYDPTTQNDNIYTLRGLNLQAKKWSDTETFFKFMEYYGSEEFLDEIITAAFQFRETEGLKNGNMNFTIYEQKGNREIVEFAVPVMTLFITVVGSMEDALYMCNRGCKDDICRETPGMWEWDSAVAYYAGSGLDLPTDKGDFLFAFADERCVDFRTCGQNGKNPVGFAKSNHDVFREFNRGQQQLLNADCRALRETKETIERLMTVPLVQGTIRYAHMLMGEAVSGRVEKHNGEASVFALSILPLVHACNPLDAEIIHNHLKPREKNTENFQAVKHALEKNYNCMNIKCSEIGGIYNSKNNTFRWDALPCNAFEEAVQGEKNPAVIAGAVGFVFVVLVGIYCLFKTCSSREQASGDDLQFAANSRSEIA
mmetsp:Transcript_4401/g.6581  ORF Transcript_4401/g.6581 Transcript_4401/m.6581 type:complete len:551 (-) Transcript_4401:62-1714(-)